jgi:esterase
MTQILHWEQEGEGPDVVVIHGLFGMGNNLGALSRALRDRYRVTRVDLPNHGRSPWVAGAGIPEMAVLLQQTLVAMGIEQAALVGHSLGGKVAMQCALHPGAFATWGLVVADIAPVAYGPGHAAVFAALDAVAAARPSGRREAAQIMARHLEDERVGQFLLLSLARGDDGRYDWRFNLQEFHASYARYREALVCETRFDGPTLFIKGGQSDYVRASHRDIILTLFPAATVRVLADAGHWLHAEEPRLFNSVVHRFLDEHRG